MLILNWTPKNYFPVPHRAIPEFQLLVTVCPYVSRHLFYITLKLNLRLRSQCTSKEQESGFQWWYIRNSQCWQKTASCVQTDVSRSELAACQEQTSGCIHAIAVVPRLSYFTYVACRLSSFSSKHTKSKNKTQGLNVLHLSCMVQPFQHLCFFTLSPANISIIYHRFFDILLYI